MQVSLLIPARNSAHALEATVSSAHRYLSERFPDDFELILIPNGNREERSNDGSLALAESLARRFASVRVQPHLEPVGKGAALKTGFESASGEWIFFTDADLPYDLDFFDEAAKNLRQGYGLVTGNRRLDHSHFNLPVSLLPLAYGRHRLGLGFNRLVRAILPIRVSDTQAGIKALSRPLAEIAFHRQVCPGFFFDLEFFLTARGHGFAHRELPVTLHLNSEKSTVRVIRESIQAAIWLSRITARSWLGRYGRNKPVNPLPGYSRAEAGIGTRFFLALRWWLTPYLRMAGEVPPRGRVLDLGCGHGLLSLAMALQSKDREITGVDHDPERVRIASQAAGALQLERRVKFTEGSALAPPDGQFDAITLIDVMHYFDGGDQRKILSRAVQRLRPGGTLLIREVDPEGGLVSQLNRLYEKLATATGFTRSQEKSLFFRSPQDWVELLESLGLRARHQRCSSPLFADVLFVAEKRASPADKTAARPEKPVS